MNVSSKIITVDNAAGQRLKLPLGLIGFPSHNEFELLFQEDQLPFRWLRLFGPEEIHFVVIEPGGLIPEYEPALFDEDASFLGIQDPADALVLNIVTVTHSEPVTATANLIGPIIVNRRTGLSKQVVLANHNRYDARFPLVVAEPANT
jgi:flagellar assembly factor FliW